MRPLADVGMVEVARLRSRVRRLLALGRVMPFDAAYIVARLDEIEARITSMIELDEQGKEIR